MPVSKGTAAPAAAKKKTTATKAPSAATKATPVQGLIRYRLTVLKPTGPYANVKPEIEVEVPVGHDGAPLIKITDIEPTILEVSQVVQTTMNTALQDYPDYNHDTVVVSDIMGEEIDTGLNDDILGEALDPVGKEEDDKEEETSPWDGKDEFNLEGEDDPLAEFAADEEVTEDGEPEDEDDILGSMLEGVEDEEEADTPAYGKAASVPAESMGDEVDEDDPLGLNL